MLVIPNRYFVWLPVCLAWFSSARVRIFAHDADLGNDDGHRHGHGHGRRGHKNHREHGSLHIDDEEQGLVLNCNRVRSLSLWCVCLHLSGDIPARDLRVDHSNIQKELAFRPSREVDCTPCRNK